MSGPKVSVLTPIYNTDLQHLRECIESVLHQTFSDFEFIILNDSPDNHALDEVVESYSDPRIRYYRNDKNMGISASRNKLLGLARGEYLAIFDHDDICVPERLALQVAALNENPKFGVVSGLLELFYPSGEKSILLAPENDTDIKVLLTHDCCIAHSAAMIRRSVLTDNGIEYEEYYTPAEDYRLWARLIGCTHFYNIQRVLTRYRAHAAQTSNRYETRMQRCHDAIALELQNLYPAYWLQMRRLDTRRATVFRVRLFGRLPLLKIKDNWVLLFEFIPVCKVKWN